MLQSAPGGVYLRGGVCSQGGCLLPGGGGCLVWRGACLPGGGVCLLGGIPACTEADTPPPPPVDRHTLVKILPWPNFVAAGNKTDRLEGFVWQCPTFRTLSILLPECSCLKWVNYVYKAAGKRAFITTTRNHGYTELRTGLQSTSRIENPYLQWWYTQGRFKIPNSFTDGLKCYGLNTTQINNFIA